METLDLLIGKDDAPFFLEAAKEFDCQVTISNGRAFISGPLHSTIARVCFWAGYLKANQMHRTLHKTA
jgi:hypothetical protein